MTIHGRAQATHHPDSEPAGHDEPFGGFTQTVQRSEDLEGLRAPARRGLPTDLVVALVGLFSMAFVAFPTLGPVKLSDLVLPVIAVRALGRRPCRLPPQLAGLVALVAVAGLIGITKAGTPAISVIGSWATGLESPTLYPAITAFRIVSTMIACFEIIWIVVSFGARAQRPLTWLLGLHMLITALVFVLGPGRDPEGQIRGTFNERGQLARYTIVLVAVVLLVRQARRIPNAVFSVVLLLALLPSLAGVALAALFGGVYGAQRLNLRLRRTTPIVVGLIALVVLAALPRMVPLVRQKADAFNSLTDDRPALGRYAALRLAPSAIAESPFIGFGLGGYIFVRDSAEFGAKLARVPHDGADSPFITALIEFGVVGGLLFAALVILGPIGSRPSARRAWPWIALNAAMMFTGSLETPLLWLTFAMATLAGTRERPDFDASGAARSAALNGRAE